VLSDINNDGISSGYATNITIRNNTLEDIGIYPGMQSFITSAINSSYGDSVTIEYNKLTNLGYNGISFYGDSVLVKNNYVNTFSSIVDDGGGIYTYTGAAPRMTNCRITGNVVLNGIGAPDGGGAFNTVANGIYLDQNSNNVEIDNNSIANCKDGCIRISQPINVDVHHNTFYNAADYIVLFSMSSTAVNVDNSFSNNIVVAKEATQRLMYFYSPSYNYVPTADLYDNNVYARPIDDNVTNNKTFIITQPSQTGDTWSKSLAEWKSFSSKDASSTKSPKSVTTVDDFGDLVELANHQNL
jgi:parallel beta-helix repeat protein